MKALISFALEQWNLGLMAGIIILVLVALSPVLARILTAQQRVCLWVVCCLGICRPSVGHSAVLPVTLQDLVAPRTGALLKPAPAFLPDEYTTAGSYHIALPGGTLVRIQLQDWLMYLLLAVWFAGMLMLVLHFWYSSRRLVKLGRRGTLLSADDPRLEGIALSDPISDTTRVYISPDLPTSFVHFVWFSRGYPHGYEIFLQEELSGQQLNLVLLHEARHIRLWHTWWKVLATVTLVWFWWNPLVWLGFRCFCRDVELACDDSVMKKLPPERHKAYAQTLLELGTGRQLWEAPLAFGESDSALRIKRLVTWKKGRWYWRLLGWCITVGLTLFLHGGHVKMQDPQDMLLAWERDTGSVEYFVQALEREMSSDLAIKEENPGAVGPEVDITGIWSAPADYPRTALWVQTEGDVWYRVLYGWWGGDAHLLGCSCSELEQSPDLTGCGRLY